MYDEWKPGTTYALLGLLTALTLGWNGCSRHLSEQDQIFQAKRFLAMTKGELGVELEGYRDPQSAPRFPEYRDRRSMAVGVVKTFLKREDSRALRNFTNPMKELYLPGKAGDVPGSIYIQAHDVSALTGGPIVMTAVYKNFWGNIRTLSEVIPVDFDPVQWPKPEAPAPWPKAEDLAHTMASQHTPSAPVVLNLKVSNKEVELQ